MTASRKHDAPTLPARKDEVGRMVGTAGGTDSQGSAISVHHHNRRVMVRSAWGNNACRRHARNNPGSTREAAATKVIARADRLARATGRAARRGSALRAKVRLNARKATAGRRVKASAAGHPPKEAVTPPPGNNDRQGNAASKRHSLTMRP